MPPRLLIPIYLNLPTKVLMFRILPFILLFIVQSVSAVETNMT